MDKLPYYNNTPRGKRVAIKGYNVLVNNVGKWMYAKNIISQIKDEDISVQTMGRYLKNYSEELGIEYEVLHNERYSKTRRYRVQ